VAIRVNMADGRIARDLMQAILAVFIFRVTLKCAGDNYPRNAILRKKKQYGGGRPIGWTMGRNYWQNF